VWLLSRPLAGDEHQVDFWARHVRLGVVLTEVTAFLTAAYGLAANRPQRVALLWLALAVMLLAPLLLTLPIRRMVWDHRGALIFYAWSVSSILVIGAATALDGGATSPLVWLLVLTLTYAGVAYPPMGVVSMGALIVATYVVVVAVGSAPLARTGFTAAVLAVFTAMTALVSQNRWDMADQQSLFAQRLATLADTDELTACLNRRAFALRLHSAVARADEEHPVSLCVLDLDGFKLVNDRQGHAAGDRVLTATARALLVAARETDTVCRLGGDEFAVLLPDTSAEFAAAAARRLRDRLSAALDEHEVTASIGIVTTARPIAAEALLATADQTMYEAKSGGRNRISQRPPA
jgi:diguanylate cyclase (GGDEF)-like protein